MFAISLDICYREIISGRAEVGLVSCSFQSIVCCCCFQLVTKKDVHICTCTLGKSVRLIMVAHLNVSVAVFLLCHYLVFCTHAYICVHTVRTGVYELYVCMCVC